jgi:hypothetical protein
MQNGGKNPLIQLLVVNLLGGSALGLALATLFLLLNLGQLRTLVLSSDQEAMALMMLFLGCASTFASAAIAGAIMLLPSHDDGAGGHGELRPTAFRARRRHGIWHSRELEEDES